MKLKNKLFILILVFAICFVVLPKKAKVTAMAETINSSAKSLRGANLDKSISFILFT